MPDDNFIFHDENDYFSTKKEGRAERKRVKNKDRSKYKKTDLGKHQEAFVLPDRPLKRGIVCSIRPQQFFVASGNETAVCSLRGTLKQDTSRQKNLVIVGDFVLFE